MKKILTIILALVLVLSMSITAFAAENNSHEVKGTYQATDESSTVYAVDVTWGNMEFTYDVPADVWNGEEHKYESGGEARWKHDEGANVVTVTNRSNAAVNVAVTTDTGSCGITASVTNSTFQLGNAAEGATTEIAGTATEGTAVITLSGELTNKSAKKSVIGSVTVTITAVEALPTPTDEDINDAIEALKAGETVVLYNVSPENHAAIVAALDEFSDGALISHSVHGIMDTYSLKDSFSDALTAWTDGTTLTLLGNTDEYPDDVTIENKTIALDLNGYKLSFNSTDSMCIRIEETGTLTIRDIRGGGEYSAYHLGFFVNGILNIEGGTIHNSVGIQRPGIVNMTGGMLYGNNKYGPHAGANSYGTFNMSGGTISSKYVVWDMSGSVVNISGDAILTATSRLFSGNEGSVITITGGTWSHDPSAYVDTENYTVTDNGDGTWTVAAK